MIDIIGMLLAAALLFALASIVSVILSTGTWLALRKPFARRKRFILAALLLPIGAAAWLLVCEAALPGESLFGDISEPLPNGFSITALGKMPDYGSLENGGHNKREATLPDCYIGKVTLDGARVVGQCSHTFGELDNPPAAPYFVFDSVTGHTSNFATEDALDHYLGHPIQLTELQFFHSPLASARRRVNGTIGFLPPACMFVVLVLAIINERRRAVARGSAT